MLKLSKKTEYAIIALMHMAENGHQKLNTAKEISEEYHIPRELMNKVLQKLAKAGIIISRQGIKGGYRLRRSLNDINLSTIICAVDGPISLTGCVVVKTCECEQIDYCNIKKPMEFIQSKLMEFFNGITLQDFKEKSKHRVPLMQIEEQRNKIKD